MIIVKDLVKIHTFANPISAERNLQNPDYVKSLCDKLYVGKCHNGVLVLEVLQVCDMSPMIINCNSVEGNANKSFRLRVRCRVLVQGEPVVGCTFIKKGSKNALVSDSPLVKAFTSWPENLKMFLRYGQILPLIVNSTRYSPGDTTIGINSRLYTPNQRVQMFEVVDDTIAPATATTRGAARQDTRRYRLDELLSVPQIIAEIDTEITWIQNADAEARDFFLRVTCGKRTLDAKRESVAGSSTQIIQDFVQMARDGTAFESGTTVLFAGDIHRVLPLVRVQQGSVAVEPVAHTTHAPGMNVADVIANATKGSADSAPPQCVPQRITPAALVLYLLSEHLMYLKLLHGLIETYNTKQLRDDHDNLWMYYTEHF